MGSASDPVVAPRRFAVGMLRRKKSAVEYVGDDVGGILDVAIGVARRACDEHTEWTRNLAPSIFFLPVVVCEGG